MKSVIPLIDKAAKVCGGYEKLAERMNTSPAAVSHMKAGKRPISPETAAELADIAGEDVQWAVNMAIIERNAGTEKGSRLARILGEARYVTGAAVLAMLLFSHEDSHATPTVSVSEHLCQLTKMHIVEPIRNAIRGLRRLLWGPLVRVA
jgi:transcriptional regulator with XRE-family HTH domain